MFLRLADLISTKYRSLVLATTMVGQVDSLLYSGGGGERERGRGEGGREGLLAVSCHARLGAGHAFCERA